MRLFTEPEIREVRRRLGIGSTPGRLAQSFGTQAHAHAEADVAGLTAALAAKAALAAVQSFTGSTNEFVNINASGGITAVGNLATDTNLVCDTLTISPSGLTDVRAQTWADKDGEIPAASGTKDGTKFLRDDGTWQSVPADDTPTLAYTAQAGTYAILTTDCVVKATSGTWTATLPTAVGVTGKLYIVKNSGAGVITLACTGGQTIDGAATQTLAANVSLSVVSDGANWIIV